MNRNVIIVDDEIHILKSLGRELNDWLEDNKLTLKSCLEGKAVMNLPHSDIVNSQIIISDLKMPEMKGYDVINYVKSINPDISCILLTGYSDMEEITQAISAGIDSFIQKPWDSDVLQAQLDKALLLNNLKRINKEQNHKMSEDLVWVKRMQAAILNRNVFDNIGMEYKLFYHAKEDTECSGIYYHMQRFGDKLLIIGADLGISSFKGTFYSYFIQQFFKDTGAGIIEGGGGAASLLSELNDYLFTLPEVSDFLECHAWIGILNTKTNQLNYANAGAPPFYFIHQGEVSLLSSTGPELGLQKNVSFRDFTFQIMKNTSLILLSSGLFPENELFFPKSEEFKRIILESVKHDNPPQLIFEYLQNKSKKQSDFYCIWMHI